MVKGLSAGTEEELKMSFNSNHSFRPAVHKTPGTDLSNLRFPCELHVSFNQKWMKRGFALPHQLWEHLKVGSVDQRGINATKTPVRTVNSRAPARPPESKALGAGSGELYCNKSSRWVGCMLDFENWWLRSLRTKTWKRKSTKYL